MVKAEERESFTLSNQGDKIFGVLHRPLNKVKAPLIVFCQGFGGNKCGRMGIYVTLAQELAKQGFIVARFDCRGTGDSEGDNTSLTLLDKVDDTLKVLDFLGQDKQVDKDRIGIFGRSLGGAVAILVAEKLGNIRSVALWAPIFSGNQWKNLWIKAQQNPTDSTVQNELKKIPGEIPNKHFLKELFELNLSDKLFLLSAVPLLHIQGEKDSVVHIAHADLFKESCKDFKKSKFIRLENSDHDFALSPDKSQAMQETIEWFKNTVE